MMDNVFIAHTVTTPGSFQYDMNSVLLIHRVLVKGLVNATHGSLSPSSVVVRLPFWSSEKCSTKDLLRNHISDLKKINSESQGTENYCCSAQLL